jgi:hypothetical protein
MARMPGAVWKPLPRGFGTKMAAFDIVCLHTMVGSLAGTDGYFRGLTNGVNSHFGTGGGGEIWQWGDTAMRSGANGNGNHHIISIENADMGAGFAAWNTNDGAAVPAFTAAQIEANAKICAWANRTHGIPLELIPDAKPGRRGIGYHRLGVPGYMVAGAEQWSSSTGKVCPGNRRIAQVPQIIARARQLAGGAAPTPTVEDDMFEASDRQALNNVAVLLSQHLAPAIGRIDAALGGNRFEWLRAQIATEVTEALESVQTGGVDADAIADRIAERLRARLEA